MLVNMGYPRTAVNKSLREEKFDDIFATYLLLMEKHNELEGGDSTMNLAPATNGPQGS
jgi:hypothetical protein